MSLSYSQLPIERGESEGHPLHGTDGAGQKTSLALLPSPAPADNPDLSDNRCLEEATGVGNAKSRPSTTINVALIKHWLHYCSQNHDSHCSDLQLRTKSGAEASIMLIDVRNNCLVTATTAFRYCALSYVWGGVSQLQATRSSVDDLKQPGALLRNRSAISRVVQDAIELVRLLGEPFLWVDSLCIVQDDVEMKNQQISQMGIIYCNAVLTIITASARDASACLPGVRANTRTPQDWKHDACELNTPTAPDTVLEDIGRSVYASRAWTFQERVLSRRRLYICDQQVYFECSSAFWCEEPPSRPFDGPDPLKICIMPGNMMAYAFEWARAINEREWDKAFAFCSILISDYSKKQMSYPSDVLNACSGILSALQRYSFWRFYYGLPEPLLELALLWTPAGVSERRPPATDGPGSSFPSWSWVGWIGAVNFDVVFDETFHNVLPRIWDLEIQELSQPSGFRRVGVSDWGRKKDPNNPMHLTTMLSDPDERPAPQDAIDSNIGILLRMRVSKAEAKPLEFRAATLGRASRSELGPQNGVFLYHNGRICGLLYGVEATRLQTYDVSSLLLLQLFVRPKPPELYFFEDVQAYNEYSEWSYGFTWDALPVSDMMLVEREGAYCERIAIGHIDEEAWWQLGPELETITLA